MERSVCEETIEKRVDWVKWEALEDKSPFEEWDYQFFEDEDGVVRVLWLCQSLINDVYFFIYCDGTNPF